eukprot:6204522-Pleurochrysis_carterae.AAC.1
MARRLWCMSDTLVTVYIQYRMVLMSITVRTQLRARLLGCTNFYKRASRASWYLRLQTKTDCGSCCAGTGAGHVKYAGKVLHAVTDAFALF